MVSDSGYNWSWSCPSTRTSRAEISGTRLRQWFSRPSSHMTLERCSVSGVAVPEYPAGAVGPRYGLLAIAAVCPTDVDPKEGNSTHTPPQAQVSSGWSNSVSAQYRIPYAGRHRTKEGIETIQLLWLRIRCTRSLTAQPNQASGIPSFLWRR